MSEWKEYKLGEVCELIVDCVNRTAPTVDYPTPYKMIRTTNVKNGKIDVHDVRYATEETYKTWIRRGKPEIGDIVLTREAPVGEVGVIRTDDKLFLGQRTMMYRPDSNIADSDFLYYSFLTASLKEQILGAAMGSVVEHIRVPDAKEFKVLLPELPEQVGISSILRSLDDKIDLLHHQNKTLEAMAETLFRQWFVEEAEESWEVGTVIDLFVLQRGYDLPVQNRNTGKYPIISSSGISGFHHECKVIGPGIVTGRSGVIGNVYYVKGDFWPLNTSLYVKEYKVAKPLFTYFFLKSLDLKSLNGGSAVPTLNRNDVHSIETLLPPQSLIASFEVKVGDMFAKRELNLNQIKTLTALRDDLLHKLMNGEIKLM